MQFCESCGNILTIKNSVKGRILFCKSCNKEYPLTEEIIFTTKYDEQKTAKLLPEGVTEFATTKTLCPRCEKEVEAEWAMQQTRGGDEPPTRFYRCKECGHVWRDYS